MICPNCKNNIMDGCQTCPVCGMRFGETKKKFSGMSIVGFILSLLCLWPVGMILAIIDLVNNKDNKHGFSVATLVIAGAHIIFILFALISGSAEDRISQYNTHAETTTEVTTEMVTTMEETSEAAAEMSGEDAYGSDERAAGDYSDEDSASSSSGEVDPGLKEYLDSYEDFMDEYVAFMKNFKNSGDTASMMTDYYQMLSEYTEFAAKADEYDQSEMSPADLAYYTEVMGRITKKLLEVSY